MPVASTIDIQRQNLPVSKFRNAIVDSVMQNDVTLIAGETGSGKSTQIPQFLYDARHRFKRGRELLEKQFRVCVTQPRRVAAIALAKRVAEECGEKSTGGRVGYRVRFEESISRQTSICFLTDGMLVREAVLDNGVFRDYSVVILDEVHERSLHTDILLGMLSQAVVRRRNTETPLKVIVMSATMTTDSFASFFNKLTLTTNLVTIPGRSFPVQMFYTAEVEHDYVEASVCTIMQINQDEPGGDILVFLPGQDDIESVSLSLVSRAKHASSVSSLFSLVIVHLYASLSSERQSAAFAPVETNKRKVILSTNIAETSLTIPGVRYVVDCGLVKLKSVVGQMEVLRIVPASKATAIQRSGRAGREAPGVCFRLYRESDFEKLASSTPPEIIRCELTSVLLQVAAMSLVPKLYPSLGSFPFIDAPSSQSITRAEIALKRLGAMTNNTISDYGRELAAFPLHPMLAHMVLTSVEFSCTKEAIILAALLSVDNLLSKKGQYKKKSYSSDHWSLVSMYMGKDDKSLNAGAMKKAGQIISQISRIFKHKISSTLDDSTRFKQCLAKSFWQNCAKLVEKGQYETLDKISCYIHPSSSVTNDSPKCIVYTEIVQTSRNYLRGVTSIEPEWLTQFVPTYFRPAT